MLDLKMSAIENFKDFSGFRICPPHSKAGHSPGLIAIEKIVTHRVFANAMNSRTTLAIAQDYILNLNEDATLSQVARGKMLEDSSFF